MHEKIVRANTVYICGNFHHEKIFANFVTCSYILVKYIHQMFLQYKEGSWDWRDFYPGKISTYMLDNIIMSLLVLSSIKTGDCIRSTLTAGSSELIVTMNCSVFSMAESSESMIVKHMIAGRAVMFTFISILS